MIPILASNRPAPKTLDQAIAQTLPASSDESYFILKDFLAQKFQIAMGHARTNRDAELIIQRLFDSLTAREVLPFPNKENL